MIIRAMSSQEKRAGAMKGGYTIVKETGTLERIIIGAGSELSLAVDAAKELGPGTRVVSMPCVEVFEKQVTTFLIW